MVRRACLLKTFAALLLATSGTVMAGQALIVDHACTDLTLIPDSAIAAAAAKRLVVRHASVGANIDDGLNALQTSDARFDRSKWDFPDRGNPGWQAKVDDLAQFAADNANSYDVITMKLCFIDTDADWTYYRDAMNQLETTYPSKVFIWWTMPIETTGSAQRDAFNNNVRSYCQANGKILFDIADIESHDPAGNHLMDGSNEHMYDAYSSDGGHLSADGARRVASGLWWLMARVAGWDGGSGGGGGGGTDPLLDSDGDGVSDVHELADGTDPNNVGSFLARDLPVGKLSGSIKLKTSGRDSCTLSATIPGVAAGFSPSGAVLVVDVAGAQQSFSLNPKGQGQSGSSKATLKLRPLQRNADGTTVFGGGDVPLKVNLRNGNWSAAWGAAGVATDQDARNAQAQLQVTVTFNGYRYAAQVPVIYSAKAGVSGRFSD